jgi:hypothetical protein
MEKIKIILEELFNCSKLFCLNEFLDFLTGCSKGMFFFQNDNSHYDNLELNMKESEKNIINSDEEEEEEDNLNEIVVN